MGSSTSIAQEYYKLQELWTEIDAKTDWKLAIWVAAYSDVDIIDKFMEIERSPVGVFDDIFFRFETPYKGNDSEFEQSLWEEYIEWFTEKLDPSVDIIQALKNEGMLNSNYLPNRKLEPTVVNLWKELLRLKSCIEGLEEVHFCVYFPPTLPDGPKLTDWFSNALDDGVPKGIRLATIDYSEHRKVKLSSSSKVILLKPQLNMLDAISNDMDKDSDSYNTVGAENRFRKQIRVVMDCTLKKDNKLMGKETSRLSTISKEMGTVSAEISGLMIISQAYYSIGNHDECEKYADKAIDKSEEAIKASDPTGYPVWKAAVLLKAAVLSGRKERRGAIEYYNLLSDKAIEQIDAFYAMEGYRMAGHLYYELGELETALEFMLLALSAGAYLDREVRRQSTFLHAAALAILLTRKEREFRDVEILEEQLAEWLGEDWRDLVETEDMKKVKQRRKASIFS